LTSVAARPAPTTHAEAASGRNVAKWIVALALFFSLLAFFSMLQVFQITSEGTSERTLQRSLAVISEIDVLLDRHYDDVRERADAVQPNEALELEDFPVSVPLTPEEVETQSRDELRQTLLERGADAMYADGTDALRDDASTGDVGMFSVGGSIDQALDLLREDVHTASGIAMTALGVISLLLAVALAAATRGFGRVVAIGAVALASAMTLFLIALLGWVSLETGGGSEYVRVEFTDISREVAWLPLRNSAILVTVAAFVTAMGAIAARVTDRERLG
jgi:hypothetical protein